jgi:hypothetical protein
MATIYLQLFCLHASQSLVFLRDKCFAKHWNKYNSHYFPLFFNFSTARGPIVQLAITGIAGAGLLPGNEATTVIGSTARGGEIGDGVSYNRSTRMLSINVGWGTTAGFTDLTSALTGAHLHGPTFRANGNGFTETASILFILNPSNIASTSGIITQEIELTSAQEAELLAGRYYINIHTANNVGGEINGFLILQA